jgi:hypothetical protein
MDQLGPRDYSEDNSIEHTIRRYVRVSYSDGQSSSRRLNSRREPSGVA